MKKIDLHVKLILLLMNILVVSYHSIYPFTTGASIAQFGAIQYLSNYFNVSLLIGEHSHFNDEELSSLSKLLPMTKIYWIEKHNSSRKAKFEGSLKNFLYSLKSEVYKKADSVLKAIRQKRRISKEEYPEDEFFSLYSSYLPYLLPSRRYVEKMIEIIGKDNIDLVQIDFTENLCLVNAIPLGIKKVFVEHECFFSRIESHIKAKEIESEFSKLILDFYKGLEVSLIQKFDAVITFSEDDSSTLKSALEGTKKKISFLTSPYPILDQDFRNIDKNSLANINKLIFVGPEYHLPNKDAVEWFIQEIATEIVERFKLQLYVIGHWTQETIQRYKNHSSQVVFLGFVDDLYSVSRKSISISPIRIGAGLRTKIMLAMAQGIPVISTQFALQGLPAKHLKSVMIAEDRKSFLFAIEYLLSDLERTFMICKEAQMIIQENFSQVTLSKARGDLYESLLHN